MFRLTVRRLTSSSGSGGKKPVSEEWKALARKQAAPYRSHDPTSSSYSSPSSGSSFSPASRATGSGGGGGGSKGGNNNNSNHHYSSSFPSDDGRGDGRSMRHFFGDAKHDKEGKVIRDIDPVDLEHKVEEYHLSRYR